LLERINMSPPAPDIFITGIPRSGTSYFCTQLHQLKDCVAINEPEEIFGMLPDPVTLRTLAAYYAQLRLTIRSGQPILNKISQGQLIEDTAVVCTDEAYQPPVSSDRFVLATKNTLAYLARLPYLLDALPKATFIACVRHPFDTLASWKTTFSHLSEATVRQFRLGYLGDPYLSQEANARLQLIDQEVQPEVRRALLWNHLAQIILEHRDRLILLRYEDLVTNPELKLRELWHSLPGAPEFLANTPFAASSVRSKRQALSVLDRSAILEHTCELASQLGYALQEEAAA
jgi:Sulfotransferase family